MVHISDEEPTDRMCPTEFMSTTGKSFLTHLTYAPSSE